MSKIQAPPERYSADWLQSLDGRTAIAQAMRERWSAITSDLGGEDRLSYAQRSLITRGLWLEFWLQQQEQALAEGKEFDSGKWTQACNSLQGLWSKIGLERRAKEVPDLGTFLHRKAG